MATKTLERSSPGNPNEKLIESVYGSELWTLLFALNSCLSATYTETHGRYLNATSIASANSEFSKKKKIDKRITRHSQSTILTLNI